MIYSFLELRLMTTGGFAGIAIREMTRSLKIELRRQILGTEECQTNKASWKFVLKVLLLQWFCNVPIKTVFNSYF